MGQARQRRRRSGTEQSEYPSGQQDHCCRAATNLIDMQLTITLARDRRVRDHVKGLNPIERREIMIRSNREEAKKRIQEDEMRYVGNG